MSEEGARVGAVATQGEAIQGDALSGVDVIRSARNPISGHLALSVVQICFGLFPVFGLAAMEPGRGFSPWALATWRITGGAVSLGLIALLIHGRRVWPGRRDLAWLALHAILGITLNQGLFLMGLARSTAMNAALLICLIPVFTFTIASLAGRETFVPRRALGVLVALASALPLFFSRGAELSSAHATGNLLMSINMLSYALFLVFSKPLTQRHPPLVVIAWLYVLSLPWLPLFAMQAPLGPIDGTPSVWWAFAYVIIFPTVLAYLLNMYALSKLAASTAAFYVFAQPFITGVAAWFVLRERFESGLWPAAAGLFLGLALVVGPIGAGRRRGP